MTIKIFKFPLLLLSILITAVTHLQVLQLASAGCHADDEAGLSGFKSGITEDPSGMLADWTPGTDCCSWEGVLCNSDGGSRVFGLWLFGTSDRYLSGTISPSLSKLEFLVTLYLKDLRNLSGPLPDVLFTLPRLASLEIDNNNLSGQLVLPENIGQVSKLQWLNLQGNRMTGPVPSSISKMSALSHMQLGRNSLTGTIPIGIRKLKKLRVLSLEENQLSGPIPDVFSSLPELYDIKLSRNRFSGGIPPSLAYLEPILYTLDLGHNSLTGRIPDSFGKLQTLVNLDLSLNKLTGVVPESFGNMTRLDHLDLSGNLLTGPFPQMNVESSSPRSIDLSNNQFNLGRIPEWVTAAPNITSLKLAKCGIDMILDGWKPAFPSLYESLDLSDNQISGSPVTLLKRMKRQLVEFRASNNQLRFDLAKLKMPKTLRKLDLSRNLVYGEVLATISGLNELKLSHNHLCGQLPESKFPADAFVGNDCLCGAPLLPCL